MNKSVFIFKAETKVYNSKYKKVIEELIKDILKIRSSDWYLVKNKVNY